MMTPPLNIDKEVIQWLAVGVCTLLIMVGIYAGGVKEGRSSHEGSDGK